ncbi:uncharacterized protein G2W53_040205 [Senna tora]|uniref:Uncharacterized protein n=1 Tax=Senna tora TaxID=362788 RepID=A0A834SQ34_9FABA|nr:uncharacterized protein G2W53_040205 [Senna tora]
MARDRKEDRMEGVSSQLKTSSFENRDSISKELKKFKFKRVIAQVSQTDRSVLNLGIRVDLMLEWGL